MNEIYEEFCHWLDNLLENNEMPEKTAAFCFNLYEESVEDSVYSTQLVACDKFDEGDPDWACEECWSSEEDVFCIELSDEAEKDRKAAQQIFTDMAVDYLTEGKYGKILSSKEAVGIGFVDGDIELLYRTK